MTEEHDGSELCFPQLNTSCRKPVTSLSEAVSLRFLLSCFSVLTVVLNLLVIISISHFRQLHKPTNLLLLSLSVSDFLVGLVFMPGEILRKTSCWFLGDFMCSLYKYLSIVSISASVGNMVLISVDRHVAICDPLHYPTRVTVGRVKLCIFLCWFCSILYSSLFVKDESHQNEKYISCHGECVYHIDYALGVFDIFVSFIVPVTVIIVLYLRVFVVAVSQARTMRSQIKTVKLQHSVTLTSRKSELKAARTLGVLVLVFLICFCPFYCVALVGGNIINTSYGIFVLCLICFNSCLNPVIYALFYPWFRRSVKLIVTLQILQPGSCEANIL
ncbi:trace amine-associated receptor 13c-like [Anabas testudineus]|uniref:trace amine-associated receptor 13c-like n=1 Tax=Anabas testudineus TaxID=64144 RepID=UPI000E45960C|nr:trace amine-associated receptor 13c-like [Anabas testudineus]